MGAHESPEAFSAGLFIGSLLTLICFGIGSAQVYYYFNLFGSSDHLSVRALVASTWMSEALHTGFVFATLYLKFVAGYGDESVLRGSQWTEGIIILFQAISSTLVNAFYVYRIWKLSGKKTIPALIVFWLAIRAGAAIAGTYYLESNANEQSLGNKLTIIIGIPSELISDILVAVAMVYYLRRVQSEHIFHTPDGTTGSQFSFSRTARITELLLKYAISTGVLTTVMQSITLIVYLTTPGSLSFIGVYFLTGTIYQNSLMASLNLRKRLRNMDVTTTIAAQTYGATRPSAERHGPGARGAGTRQTNSTFQVISQPDTEDEACHSFGHKVNAPRSTRRPNVAIDDNIEMPELRPGETYQSGTSDSSRYGFKIDPDSIA